MTDEPKEPNTPNMLDEFLEKAAKEMKGKPFIPFAFWNEDGDQIEVYLENASCNWSQANPYASIGYADDDGRVVAFEICAPKKIIEEGSLTLSGTGKMHRQRRPAHLELEAARALVLKLDECKDHITGAFQMAYQIRGHEYTGPNYGEELDALRELLGMEKPEES